MNHFGDPGYRYHTLMSQLWGVTALRLANADLLPFDFATYASNIRQFVNELSKANEKAMWGQPPSAVHSSEARSSQQSPVNLSEVAAKRSDPATPSKDPAPAGTTPNASGSSDPGSLSDSRPMSQLDLSRVRKAIDAFESAGIKLNESLTRELATGKINPQLAATLNHGMMQTERNWLNPDGIPGRPWFKHILYGARFTYAHLELPGLTEAVENQDWPTAKQQSEILERALEKNTKLLSDLNATLTAELAARK